MCCRLVSQLGLMFEQLHRHFQPSARASWSRASQSDSRILTATAATTTDPQADHFGSQGSLRNTLSFYRGPRAHNPAPILTAAGKICWPILWKPPTQGLVAKIKGGVKKERTLNMLCKPQAFFHRFCGFQNNRISETLSLGEKSLRILEFSKESFHFL